MSKRVNDTHELLKDLLAGLNEVKERLEKLEIEAEQAQGAEAGEAAGQEATVEAEDEAAGEQADEQATEYHSDDDDHDH
jgi:Sec-independent protein translocase protein TatA